ncbi:unnamed protein product [Clonostachys solani]|uniref:Uncharacterized protein n=1 Tax=Clonostachys solani TaxID=160281 RepID=A0A9N9ZG04_9HYPO|nr:unnamed protein product [Clonostachys solani]
MVKTYVIAPNFSMAPPPRLRRPDETPEFGPVAAAPVTGPGIGEDLDKGQPLADDEAATDDDGAASKDDDTPAPDEPTLIPTAEGAGAPTSIPPYHPLVELQLGDVLIHPFGAELAALNRDCRVAIDANHYEKMHRTRNFNKTRRELLNGRLGVWESLFAAIGAGPELNASIFWESRSDDIIKTDELQTRRVRITKPYVEKVLESPAVKSHLQNFPNDVLWMVSGMKIAKGASQTSGSSTNMGADIGAKDKLTASELRLLKLLWKRWDRTTFQASSEFILAVQLRRIRLVEGKLVSVTLSGRRANMADGAKRREEEVVNVELEGIDDSLSDAEEQFSNDFEKRKDANGDELFVPDLYGDLNEEDSESEEED